MEQVMRKRFVDSDLIFSSGVYETGIELVGFKCYTPRGILVLAKDLIYGRRITIKISLSVQLSEGYS